MTYVEWQEDRIAQDQTPPITIAIVHERLCNVVEQENARKQHDQQSQQDHYQIENGARLVQ